MPNSNFIKIQPKLVPALDTGFLPVSLWSRAFREEAEKTPGSRFVVLQVARPDGASWIFPNRLFPDQPAFREANLRYMERWVKSLLWAVGGSTIRLRGAPEMVPLLGNLYGPSGVRAFDHAFIGETCFGYPLVFEDGEGRELEGSEAGSQGGEASLGGCRIGFDLGGSDRKAAAVIDGEVVFSEEIPWDPYFQKDPDYHREGIRDSIRRAAAHLPRVDAIGGSAAGIYIDNEPKVGSLFRGLSQDDFDRSIRPFFRELREEWGGVPFEVANDGDVSALAGSLFLKENRVLGISMGTSEAAGYINAAGRVTGWLNELAFVPVDMRIDGPVDEWSGDVGCGVQFFSQQGVARLLASSALPVPEGSSPAEKLAWLQEKMASGDGRAEEVFSSIGIAFGYALAQYAELYEMENLLFLGRVSSGEGGEIILAKAREVLHKEFPDQAGGIRLRMPDEKMKRHGQAVAAAALPRLETPKHDESQPSSL